MRLLNCRTIQKAATQTGVNESTVWRWMRDQASQEALERQSIRIVAQGNVPAFDVYRQTRKVIVVNKGCPNEDKFLVDIDNP